MVRTGLRWSLLFLFAACAVESVPLVEFADESGSDASSLDAGEAGAGPNDGSTWGQTCFANRDCDVSSFCNRVGCGATFGTCTPRPTSCDERFEPVCDCEGVTYFNDCVRRLYGARVAFACTARRTCGDALSSECPEDAFCTHLVPDESDCDLARFSGVCLVSHPRCRDGRIASEQFSSCEQPDQCVDLCTAIRSEQPHTFCGMRPR